MIEQPNNIIPYSLSKNQYIIDTYPRTRRALKELGYSIDE